jgi:imidazolonepropionase-like amidohydrolase
MSVPTAPSAAPVKLGVRSLEHCNLISAETAKLAAEKGCIAIPTLVAYDALWLEGKALGLGPTEFDKSVVRSGGLKSLEIMHDAGLPMAFGSDLLGGLRKYHCMEFELLAEVLTPAEIIRSATVGAGGAVPDDGADRDDRRGGVCGSDRGGWGIRSRISRCCKGMGRICR